VPALVLIRFLQTFRAHVGPVYRATWGPDSRLLITASEDSTIKLWRVKVRGADTFPPCPFSCVRAHPRPCGPWSQDQKLLKDLPGHEGSVFAVDWAPNGYLPVPRGFPASLLC
jgi:ribosome assembly protein 4